MSLYILTHALHQTICRLKAIPKKKRKAHNDVYCSAGTLIFSFEQTCLSGDVWDQSLFLVILY